MRPIFSSRFSYKARTKSKSRSTSKNVGWISAGVLFLSTLSFYCVLFPEMSGLWGQKIAQFLGWLCGAGRYLLPLWLGWIAALRVFHREKSWNTLQMVLSAGLFGMILV